MSNGNSDIHELLNGVELLDAICFKRKNKCICNIDREFNCRSVPSNTQKTFQQTGILVIIDLFKYKRYIRWFDDVSAFFH